ncbi:MAG: HAMP domain-containing histidine kinase [Candidatus Zixiibacteriota bacterium]|nr:MAG: HAMP domain-containing histidine kinase [candidate division Zixibacteria bacterium]
MSENQDDRLKEEGLAFFGAITASVTHELNNVTAVINELTGLLDDILYGAGQGMPIDAEKLRSLQERLSKQVDRGRTIIKRLNKYAHTTDKAVVEYDLKAVLGNLTDICRRFADMKKVRLEGRFPPDPVNVSGNPFAMQHAVYLCIRYALENAAVDNVIGVNASRDESGIRVEITGPGIDGTKIEDKQLALLRTLLEAQEGELDFVRDSGGSQSIVLGFPDILTKQV